MPFDDNIMQRNILNSWYFMIQYEYRDKGVVSMKNAIEEAKRKSEGKNNHILEIGLQDEQKDNYKICEYLKMNPGVFTGSGAVLVAILSALINFVAIYMKVPY